jgi:hypothetical protein
LCSPVTKEKNPERFKKNENSFTAETVDCPHVGQNLASLSRRLAASANRRFEFHKSGQLFIPAHNETLFVVAMCVSDNWRPLFAIAEVRSSPN